MGTVPGGGSTDWMSSPFSKILADGWIFVRGSVRKYAMIDSFVLAASKK